MNKTKTLLLTTLGILLSFTIAIGGWQLTNRLINMESDRLLGTATAFAVDMPAIPLSDAPLEEDNAPRTLDERAITSILHNWADRGVNRWHEPAPGQITMEQVILTAREWVVFLQNYNLLPENISFTSQVAFLSQNTGPMDSFLPQEYSYWTVNFGSDDIHLYMQVNAVTGQVWATEVTLAHYLRMWERSHHISHDEMQGALTAYMALLGIDGALDGALDYLLFQQDWFVDEQGAIVLVENPPWEIVSDERATVTFENAAWVLPPTPPTEGEHAVTVLEPPRIIVLPPEFRRRKSIAYPFGDGELTAVISVFGMPDFEDGVHFDWLTIGLSVGAPGM